jgi:hypothetical protein
MALRKQPKYFETLHSRYYRLPKELWDIIWSYDNRYKIVFKQCVHELNCEFNRNRIVDHLYGEMNIYNLYSMNRSNSGLYAKYHTFYDYNRAKKKIFGDQVNPDFLKHLSLKKIQGVTNEQ